MRFVENEQDADTECRRVTTLLQGLRFKAHVRVVWLQPIQGTGPSECYNHYKKKANRQKISSIPSDLAASSSAEASASRETLVQVPEPVKKPTKKPSYQALDIQGHSVFNHLSSKTQHLIMNQLIKFHCDQSNIIITTLIAPDPKTCHSESESLIYLEQIQTLVQDLPPILLVHGKGLTVTMSL